MISIGRIVLVCIGYSNQEGMPVATAEEGEPVLRPAIVTRVWSGDCINAQIILDGTNDLRFAESYPSGILVAENCKVGSKWATSSCRGTRIGEWCWPPRV